MSTTLGDRPGTPIWAKKRKIRRGDEFGSVINVEETFASRDQLWKDIARIGVMSWIRPSMKPSGHSHKIELQMLHLFSVFLLLWRHPAATQLSVSARSYLSCRSGECPGQRLWCSAWWHRGGSWPPRSLSHTAACRGLRDTGKVTFEYQAILYAIFIVISMNVIWIILS